MKRAVGCCIVAVVALVSLPGCSKIIDWGKNNFYQGLEYDTYEKMAKPFIRSVTIYDQFTTDAHFDVLWLSDAVRTAYADLHGIRLAKSLEHANIFLRRQLEENDHYLSFYVLSLYGIKLGTPESHWSFYLEVDGKNYQPLELKLQDLAYEYRVFFGKIYNRFKEPYHLRFNARDLEGNQIIKSTTTHMKLHVRSAHTGSVFTWDFNPKSVMPKESTDTKPISVQHKRKKRSKRCLE